MKRKEIFKLKNTIENLQEYLKKENQKIPFSLSVKLSKNKKAAEEFIKTIQESVEIPEKYNEYLEKEKEIINKYAIKKEDGSIDMNNNQVKIENDYIEKASSELNKLKEEYKDTIEEYKKVEKEYDEYLEKEIEEKEITLIDIYYKDFPESFEISDMSIIVNLLDFLKENE
jgi:hypothetical protein